MPKKPTAKQLTAIRNIIKGFKITNPELLKEPKTIIQASRLIGKLLKEAQLIKSELNWSDNDDFYRQEMGDIEGDPYFYGQ